MDKSEARKLNEENSSELISQWDANFAHPINVEMIFKKLARQVNINKELMNQIEKLEKEVAKIDELEKFVATLKRHKPAAG